MSQQPNPVAAEAIGQQDVEAEYALETPARCPGCQKDLDTVQVARLLRTRVNFVSGLPRRGQIMICPECRTILTGSLGGFV